jgi:hypothetical protein
VVAADEEEANAAVVEEVQFLQHNMLKIDMGLICPRAELGNYLYK